MDVGPNDSGNDTKKESIVSDKTVDNYTPLNAEMSEAPPTQFVSTLKRMLSDESAKRFRTE